MLAVAVTACGNLVATRGDVWRDSWGLFRNLSSFEGSIWAFDSIARLLNWLMLAVGLSLGLVVGVGFAKLTSILVAALHVASEQLYSINRSIDYMVNH